MPCYAYLEGKKGSSLVVTPIYLTAEDLVERIVALYNEAKGVTGGNRAE
jgi:hypothetical protein